MGTVSGRFPILDDYRDRLPPDLLSVEWAKLLPWRAQIEKNHDQTLERLASRGGLSWSEIWWAISGSLWVPDKTEREAAALVLPRLEAGR